MQRLSRKDVANLRPMFLRQMPRAAVGHLEDAFARNDLEAFDHILAKCPAYNIHTMHELDTVIQYAMSQDNVAAIRILLNHGAGPIRYLAPDSIRARAMDVLDLLLDNGLDINKRVSDLGPTVFAYAMQDESLTRWMLELGGDLNKQTIVSTTPMSHAAQHASLDFLQQLLDRGGDVQKGELLHHALDRQDNILGALRILIDRGAPINEKCYENHESSRIFLFQDVRDTALHKAASNGQIDAVRYLLARGADPTCLDTDDETAANRAEREGHYEVARLLNPEPQNQLSADEPIDSSNVGRYTPRL